MYDNTSDFTNRTHLKRNEITVVVTIKAYLALTILLI